MYSQRMSTQRNSYRVLLWCLFVLLTASEAYSQVYQATLNHRRRGNQIWVEVWMKSLTPSAPKLGEASLVIQYNSTNLTPSATQAPGSTDTVGYDVDVATPVVTVASQFDGANGYQALATQSYGAGYYSLEVRKAVGGSTGIVPSSTGRGSFVGLVKFDIVTTGITDATLTQVNWSTSTLPGDIVIYDYNDNNIESQITLTNPADFTIIGITLLNPNGPSEVLDRDKTYASVAGGYPIYFERSGIVTAGNYGAAGAAYVFDYSVNAGTSWTEFGRADENGTNVTEITAAAVTAAGGGAAAANGQEIVRAIWATSTAFSTRSEEARIRITQLATAGALAGRARQTRLDASDNNFVLGRLFFAQLNGTNQYFRTVGNFSNPTQITVEAWVNLNEYKPTGSEVGLVASAAGPISTEEGAWMLYLHDGKYPAFRAREILGRGTGGYIAKVISPIALDMVSDAIPLGASHGSNWVHLAATVKDGTVKLYVNGEMVESVTNDQATNIRMMSTNHPIWVGVNPNISIESGDYFHGGIKGVQVWRNELTQAQIRTRVSGVVSPTNVGTVPADPEFINRSLEIYYTFEGTRTDGASDATYQNGDQASQFYLDGAVANASTRFRPDQPHIKVTAPSGCDGISNLTGNNFSVRWVAYGVGDNTASGRDLEIQFSLDGGTSWTYARNSAGTAAANDLGGAAGVAIDVEAGTATWQPYNNEGTSTQGGAPQNLRSVATTYAKSVVMRVRGYVAAQNEVVGQTESFTVAPYFSMQRTANTRIEIPSGTSMNVTGQTFAVEAWIRPYRFPTDLEGSFPIICKIDTATKKPHYALSLLPSGRLELRVTDTAGTVRTALSSATETLVRPNSIAVDSAWTHVAAWVNVGNGVGASEVRFYIDGTPQRADTVTTQLGSGITLNLLNTYPAYIGSEPTATTTRSFVGEIRDLRFWNGTPANAATTGAEPTALTNHIQGALNVLGSTLNGTSDDNLTVCFAMNGGTINSSGYQKAIVSEVGGVRASVATGSGMCYSAVRPAIKLVEPVFNQRVRNTTTNLRVRWVGFHYNGSATGFTGGVNAGAAPSLEFSIRGGGGVVVQPYQYVTSDYYSATYTDAIALPAGMNFTGHTGSNMRYGLTLDMSIADPDLSNDGTFDDSTAMSATLTNARLRVNNSYTINTTATTVLSEGPLFTVTPPSNLTLRVLLEGYHDGLNGVSFSNLASTYTGGGLRVKLYRNNAGTPGALVATSESEFGYDPLAFSASAIANLGTNTGNGEYFATVPFVFTDLPDGSYWVVVEHPNHLPIMSKTPATFQYAGDDVTSTTIESGWDFSTWNGTDDDASYSAYGSAKSTTSAPAFSTTGLVWSEGRDGLGLAANRIASMIGGDVEKDGQINAADRVRVRADAGTSLVRSDVTGDGSVGAADRNLVDVNFGRVSSIYNVSFPIAQSGGGASGLVMGKTPTANPFNYISELDPTLSVSLNDAAVTANETQSALPIKHMNATQGNTYKYTVWAEPQVNKTTVEVPVYIQNNGSPFNLGNATFAMEFNPKRMRFVGLTGTDKVTFTNKPTKGYNAMYSAPRTNADQPLNNVRTIEVDYDAYSRKGGEAVPTEKTYLGTLRFELLNNAGSVSFKWHKSASVYGSQLESLTGAGDFKPVNGIMLYSATVTAPAVGARLGMGRTYPVTWTTTGNNATVFVEYSTDGGNSWVRMMEKAIDVTTLSYDFTAPTVTASDCFVRLVDEETGTELSRSKKFAIVNISGNITRPATTDPVYTSGLNDIIRWQSAGLSNVRFEFSANGRDGWTTVVANRNATDGSVSWKIPAANTKSAVVRMIDLEDGSEINRTGLFKILSGTLSFLNPNSGEIMKPSQTTRLRWRIANDVKEVNLQYSVDGGTTWTTFVEKADARKQYFDWVIPTVNSKRVVVRAIYPGEPELEYSRTPEFRIDGPVEVREENAEGYAFAEPVPNPANNVATVGFTLPTTQEVSVVVFNQLGERVATLISNKLYQAGDYKVELPVEPLSQGSYHLQLQAGTYISSRTLVIVR